MRAPLSAAHQNCSIVCFGLISDCGLVPEAYGHGNSQFRTSGGSSRLPHLGLDDVSDSRKELADKFQQLLVVAA